MFVEVPVCWNSCCRKKIQESCDYFFSLRRRLKSIPSHCLVLFLDPFGGDPFKESDPFKGTSSEDFFKRTDKSDLFGSSDPFGRKPTPPAKVSNTSIFYHSDEVCWKFRSQFLCMQYDCEKTNALLSKVQMIFPFSLFNNLL